MKPKIVITGLGAVCGAGKTAGEIFEAILAGQSAVKEISGWNAQSWPRQMAAEVTGVDNRTLVEDRKLHKMISRTDLFGLYAANAAIAQSGLTTHRDSLGAAVAEFNDRSGIFVGSGGGNYGCNYDFFPAMSAAGGDLKKFGAQFAESVNPMWLLRNLPNNVLCHVGIRHHFKGANACITNHCTSGALAVAEAAAAIVAGEADRAVAIGHDSPIEPETQLNFQQLELLAAAALRPFDRDRDGTVLGEGAAALVLEKEPDAKLRGATVLGEFLGSGCVTEATGVLRIRPDGNGVARAIELALADAKISRADIGVIVAHGNATRASDASETAGIHRVFGQKIPPVTGFKWACGHTIAASGILDLVLALTLLQRKIVPGIATLNWTDPDFSPLPVSAKPQSLCGETALVICRGFGGMNVALIVRAAQP